MISLLRPFLFLIDFVLILMLYIKDMKNYFNKMKYLALAAVALLFSGCELA